MDEGPEGAANQRPAPAEVCRFVEAAREAMSVLMLDAAGTAELRDALVTAENALNPFNQVQALRAIRQARYVLVELAHGPCRSHARRLRCPHSRR
ncbi:hypothetical protein AB0M43_35350 [Longispora sp. NPDC051575]|uniref:hypothetical protein n=1 Tax=Longispora sp. NPDC051575 TaxID=3154943 RepID=UPI00343C9778